MNNYNTNLLHDASDKEYIDSMYKKADAMAYDYLNSFSTWSGVLCNRWNRAVDTIKGITEARSNYNVVRRSKENIYEYVDKFKCLYFDNDMTSRAMKRHIYPENEWGFAGLLEDLKQEPADVIEQFIKHYWNYHEWDGVHKEYIYLRDCGENSVALDVISPNYTIFLMLAVMEDIIEQENK